MNLTPKKEAVLWWWHCGGRKDLRKGRESCNRAMGWIEISNQWKLIEDDMVGELLNFLLRLFELNKCKAETAWNSIVV